MRYYDRLVILTCLLCAGLVIFTSWQPSKKDKKQVQLHDFFKRLQIAEQHGEAISYKLSKLLDYLNSTGATKIVTANSSAQHEEGSAFFNFSQSSALLHLPHLREHPDSLTPLVHIGQGRSGVSLIFGIPTVRRQKESYLLKTLNSLIFDLTTKQKEDIVIIVFVAETDDAFVRSVAQSLQKKFPDEVNSGLLEVISPSPYFYPNWTNLKETFGDSKERVKWRTKQNLDYSFLMLYAHSKGLYYIQLEDDIVARSGYTDTIKAYVDRMYEDQWLFIEFSALGFIGKLFRASALPTIVEFFLMFHKDKPIDWLLDHMLWVKVCNPEKDHKHCNVEKSKMKRTFKPSLFQHVGLHSSLPGKIQTLKDKDFEKLPLFVAHLNPPAVLNCSLKDYEGHSLDKAYRGVDFFWAFSPIRGDYIVITFIKPQVIKAYLFKSGITEMSKDKFYNATVEALPSSLAVRQNGQKGLLKCCEPSSDGYVIIGSFVDGLAKGKIHEDLKELDAIRLIVHSDSAFWVMLNEIFINIQ